MVMWQLFATKEVGRKIRKEARTSREIESKAQARVPFFPTPTQILLHQASFVTARSVTRT
jgi:hypothetical protein